jgi:hypothetical protein
VPFPTNSLSHGHASQTLHFGTSCDAKPRTGIGFLVLALGGALHRSKAEAPADVNAALT